MNKAAVVYEKLTFLESSYILRVNEDCLEW